MGRIITEDIAEIAFAALTVTTSNDPENKTALQFYSIYPGSSCSASITSRIQSCDSSTKAHQDFELEHFATEEVSSGASNTLRSKIIPMPEILSDDDAAATPEGNIVNKKLFPD